MMITINFLVKGVVAGIEHVTANMYPTRCGDPCKYRIWLYLIVFGLIGVPEKGKQP